MDGQGSDKDVIDPHGYGEGCKEFLGHGTNSFVEGEEEVAVSHAGGCFPRSPLDGDVDGGVGRGGNGFREGRGEHRFVPAVNAVLAKKADGGGVDVDRVEEVGAGISVCSSEIEWAFGHDPRGKSR